MKMPKVLFFIGGMAPTDEEREAAMELGGASMRNASVIDATTSVEKCDAVAGDFIPPQYEGIPVVRSLSAVITIMKEKQKADKDAAAAVVNAVATPVSQTRKAKGDKASAPAEGAGAAATAETVGWQANT